ncbi:hypothetical protein Tco_1068432 [Tanacetum coccineum]|uniref:Uncharacterized protein n=1 Tax=Tanacetum coccineum TaxID=301880 RepID=A0ABQ5HHM3_9ASTR
MVDIPDDDDLVDYDPEEEDPKEELESNDGLVNQFALHVNPHQPGVMNGEVEGDKTPPPGDVSSDSVSSDFESEDEEVDVAPDDTFGTITQRPYAIRDFPRGVLEVGEPSSTHDLSYVGRLAPWALRRDLLVSRVRSRVTKAELGTCQTEIALLKSKNKIREKEREIPNHDLGNIEHVLGDVLERLKVLERRENATSKKKLVEVEMKL